MKQIIQYEESSISNEPHKLNHLEYKNKPDPSDNPDTLETINKSQIRQTRAVWDKHYLFWIFLQIAMNIYMKQLKVRQG